MPPQLAPKISQKAGDKWQELLAEYLYPGEVLWALARINGLKPMLECLAVTNARVLAFAKQDFPLNGPRIRVDADDIAAFIVEKKFSGPALTITRRSGEVVRFGTILGGDEDAKFVRFFVDHLARAGFPAGMREAIVEAARATTGVVPPGGWLHEQRRQAKAERRGEIQVVGVPLKDVHWRTLDEHSGADEIPWFVLNGQGTGMLAAFDDRLIIAKVGLDAGMMAGALGGGRITTFPYTEITNVEYNSGMINGVLEILTPSYQGSKNHDYWQSAWKNPNKVDNNPWALSNTLPLDKMSYKAALPYLNELHSRISAAKRPAAVVEQAAAGSLADELKELAGLHARGVLDDAEFAAAKQSAIRRGR